MTGEDDAVAQGFADLNLAVVGVNETLPQGLRNRLDAGQRVGGPARHGQASLIEIGAEDFEVVAQILGMAEHLADQHADGIDLFAGGTAGHPDPEAIPARALGHKAPQQLAEGLERVGVPEEGRHGDEQVLDQGRRLLAVGFQELQVILHGVHLAQCHPPRQLTLHGGVLVLAEVDAGVVRQQLQHAVEVHGLRQRHVLLHPVVTGMDEVAEVLTDGDRFEDEVGATHGDGGPGHGIEAGALRGLGDGESAGGTDGPQTTGPIGSGAREDHGRAPLPPVFGVRVEQFIDTGAGAEARLGCCQDHPVPQHADVVVRWTDGDRAGQQHGPIHRLEHLQGRDPGEQIDHQAAVVGRQVLGHDIGHVADGGEAAQEQLQRLQATCRCADADKMHW